MTRHLYPSLCAAAALVGTIIWSDAAFPLGMAAAAAGGPAWSRGRRMARRRWAAAARLRPHSPGQAT